MVNKENLIKAICTCNSLYDHHCRGCKYLKYGSACLDYLFSDILEYLTSN